MVTPVNKALERLNEYEKIAVTLGQHRLFPEGEAGEETRKAMISNLVRLDKVLGTKKEYKNNAYPVDRDEFLNYAIQAHFDGKIDLANPNVAMHDVIASVVRTLPALPCVGPDLRRIPDDEVPRIRTVRDPSFSRERAMF